MRKVSSRINDFKEIYDNYDIDSIKVEVNRCNSCKDAFCSNKIVMDNKLTGCPLNINISKVISLLKYNLYKEAYNELSINNPFPEICERVCKGYCESACINNKDNNPTKIKDILRTLADYGMDNNLVDTLVKDKVGKTVTIIGSGAAGLSCANYLIKEGYNVNVYEKDDLPGGTLMYGIPNMRLDKKILEKRINILKEMGVNFILNSEVTRIISPMDVLCDCDALVLASGVVKRRFVCDGMGLKNVIYGVDYLKKVTKNILNEGKSNITENKSILIIGAGDTALDCLSYALREKAKMVALIDQKNMPPLKRTTSWPFLDDSIKPTEEILEAISKTFMDPRSYNMTVKELVGTSYVQSAKICNVKWDNGKAIISENTQEFPIDMVIVAIGNIGVEEDLTNVFKIDIVNKLVDEKNHKNKQNIFICGDALINNGITPLAIKDGITCAKEVIKYLEAKC